MEQSQWKVSITCACWVCFGLASFRFILASKLFIRKWQAVFFICSGLVSFHFHTLSKFCQIFKCWVFTSVFGLHVQFSRRLKLELETDSADSAHISSDPFDVWTLLVCVQVWSRGCVCVPSKLARAAGGCASVFPSGSYFGTPFYI